MRPLPVRYRARLLKRRPGRYAQVQSAERAGAARLLSSADGAGPSFTPEPKYATDSFIVKYKPEALGDIVLPSNVVPLPGTPMHVVSVANGTDVQAALSRWRARAGAAAAQTRADGPHASLPPQGPCVRGPGFKGDSPPRPAPPLPAEIEFVATDDFVYAAAPATTAAPGAAHGADLAEPNDPQFIGQWGMQQVGAEGAWEIETGADTAAQAVTVCIADSGVDYT